jgi:hypothetical protein
MYSHRRHDLIGIRSGRGVVPRRRVLQGAGALGLATVLRPSAVFAERDDDDDRLGRLGRGPRRSTSAPWSTRSTSTATPRSRRMGLACTSVRTVREASTARTSLASLRSGFHSAPVSMPPGKLRSIWTRSTKGRSSMPSAPVRPSRAFRRTGICCSSPVTAQAVSAATRRSNKHDDFGWQEPVNLGSVNSPQNDTAATYFEDEETGIISLYLTSARPEGPVGSRPGTLHIYVSTLGDDGSFGPAVLVPELSSRYEERHTAIRRDGLEFFLGSSRPDGRIGLEDIWVSTRDNSTLDPWSTPVNLGSTVNYPGYVTGAPALSCDGTTTLLLLRPSRRLWGERPLCRHPRKISGFAGQKRRTKAPRSVIMKRLRPVATYHVVGIGEAIVGRLGPSVSSIPAGGC